MGPGQSDYEAYDVSSTRHSAEHVPNPGSGARPLPPASLPVHVNLPNANANTQPNFDRYPAPAESAHLRHPAHPTRKQQHLMPAAPPPRVPMAALQSVDVQMIAPQLYAAAAAAKMPMTGGLNVHHGLAPTTTDAVPPAQSTMHEHPGGDGETGASPPALESGMRQLGHLPVAPSASTVPPRFPNPHPRHLVAVPPAATGLPHSTNPHHQITSAHEHFSSEAQGSHEGPLRQNPRLLGVQGHSYNPLRPPHPQQHQLPHPDVTGPSPATQSGCRPTLFGLLEVLASDSVTNLPQRQAIRSVLHDYLTNRIPHSSLYTFIGQIVGSRKLADCVKLLSAQQEAVRSSLPLGSVEQVHSTTGFPSLNSLAKVDRAFGIQNFISEQTAPTTRPQNQSSTGPVPAPTDRAIGNNISQEGVASTANGEISSDMELSLPRGTVLREPTSDELVEAVFVDAEWHKLASHRSARPCWGHTGVLFRYKLFFFGGWTTPNGRHSEDTFRNLEIMNLWDMQSRIVSTYGHVPPACVRHSATLVNGVTQPVVFVFGGRRNVEGPQALSNDLYALELDLRRWVHIHPGGSGVASGPSPPERCSHSSTVYPSRSATTPPAPDVSVTFKTELLIIWGGLGHSPASRGSSSPREILFNDMWILDLNLVQWVEVHVSNGPAPRMGASLCWTDDNLLCLYGGETWLPMASRAGNETDPLRPPSNSSPHFGHPRNRGSFRRKILSEVWACHVQPRPPADKDNPKSEPDGAVTTSAATGPDELSESEPSSDPVAITSSSADHGIGCEGESSGTSANLNESGSKKRKGKDARAPSQKTSVTTRRAGGNSGGESALLQPSDTGTSQSATPNGENATDGTPAGEVGSITSGGSAKFESNSIAARDSQMNQSVPSHVSSPDAPADAAAGVSTPSCPLITKWVRDREVEADALPRAHHTCCLLSQYQHSTGEHHTVMVVVGGVTQDPSPSSENPDQSSEAAQQADVEQHVAHIRDSSHVLVYRYADPQGTRNIFKTEKWNQSSSSAKSETNEKQKPPERAPAPSRWRAISPSIGNTVSVPLSRTAAKTFVAASWSAVAFYQAHGLPSGRPPIPCIFVSGGLDRTNEMVKGSYLLSITGEDPYAGVVMSAFKRVLDAATTHMGTASGPADSSLGVGAPSAKSGFATDGTDHSEPSREGGADSGASADKGFVRSPSAQNALVPPHVLLNHANLTRANGSTTEALSMGSRMPMWNERPATSPGIFWPLGNLSHWLFAAVGSLLENSFKGYVESRTVKIGVERSIGILKPPASTKTPFGTVAGKSVGSFWIQDDGSGLDYQAMHKLLKKVGHFTPGDTHRRNDEYGIGFKAAFSRMANSCMVVSRTNCMVGAGLLSLQLMSHIDSQLISAPVCMWTLPKKEIITSGHPCTDLRHSQRLLMLYSPFSTPTLIASEMNKLGISPGTRLIFWDMRPDLSHFVIDNADGQVLLSDAPAVTLAPNLTVGCDTEPQSTSMPTADGCDEVDMFMNSEDGTDPQNRAEASSAARRGDENTDDASRLRESAPKQFSGSPQQNDKSRIEGEASTSSDSPSATPSLRLPPRYPFWTCPQHSIDYNLATYVYWSFLHCRAQVMLNGLQLIPAPNQINEPPTDQSSAPPPSETQNMHEDVHMALSASATARKTNLTSESERATSGSLCAVSKIPATDSLVTTEYSASLYFTLKTHLYYPAELKYLFHPSDAVYGNYGIVGFLEEPSKTHGPRLCEAGILFYYRERLISRITGRFPEDPRLITSSVTNPLGASVQNMDAMEPRPRSRASDWRYHITAAINVPDWLIPDCSRESFIHEGSAAWRAFIDNLEDLLCSYWTAVKAGPAALAKWNLMRQTKFDRYTSKISSVQKKRRKGSATDSKGFTSGILTPPITGQQEPVATGDDASSKPEAATLDTTAEAPARGCEVHVDALDGDEVAGKK